MHVDRHANMQMYICLVSKKTAQVDVGIIAMRAWILDYGTNFCNHRCQLNACLRIMFSDVDTNGDTIEYMLNVQVRVCWWLRRTSNFLANRTLCNSSTVYYSLINGETNQVAELVELSWLR